MGYSSKPQDVARGREELVRRRVEHEKKTGTALPDTRRIEKWASDTAQRADRKHQDK